jgi:hypothetical protein
MRRSECLKSQAIGWAIVDDVLGTLVIFDGRTPIYWRRDVALLEAKERGFSTRGKEPDVRICRVTVRPYSGTKR